MSGFATYQTEHLVRSDVWSAQLKKVLEDDMFAQRYIHWITDFPDGDTIHIPSVGQAEALDYHEGEAIKYTAMDTGDFTFSITEYKSSATYITNKMKQDGYYTSQLVSSFVPKQARAIKKAMEIDVLSLASNAQTPGQLNEINDAPHRFVGSGTGGVITPADFAKARYALQKANVPMVNLVAIVDPSVEYTINTMSNLVDASYNPRWEGIIADGIGTGTRFVRNIYGFDVYVSQNLPTGLVETIDGDAVTNGVANLFFSAAADVLPFVGSIRQAPKVDSEYNKDLQRDEYVTTTRYGFKLFRPENVVVGITDVDAIW